MAGENEKLTLPPPMPYAAYLIVYTALPAVRLAYVVAGDHHSRSSRQKIESADRPQHTAYISTVATRDAFTLVLKNTGRGRCRGRKPLQRLLARSIFTVVCSVANAHVLCE